jgi:hypothetical protein
MPLKEYLDKSKTKEKLKSNLLRFGLIINISGSEFRLGYFETFNLFVQRTR